MLSHLLHLVVPYTELIRIFLITCTLVLECSSNVDVLSHDLLSDQVVVAMMWLYANCTLPLQLVVLIGLLYRIRVTD